MFRRIAPLALVAVALVAPGCAASHRLDEVALERARVAVTAAIPPAPRVQAGSPAESGINPYDPIGTAVRVGTAVRKRREIRSAQARLDSLVARVDVADRVARQTLAGAARVLAFAPASRPEAADYTLDLRIADYALVADSFEGAVYFVLLGEVRLLDARTGALLWDAELAEREVLDRSTFGALFGLPASVGNVVTGRAVAQLGTDDMAAGLGRLADFAAERIVDRLATDYARSRGAYRDRQRRARPSE